MAQKLKTQTPTITKKNKNTYIVAGVSFLVFAVAIYFLFIFTSGKKDIKPSDEDNIVKDIAELALADKPYVSLSPSSDGAELIITMQNMDYFDNIEYEFTYLADNPQLQGEKIQRGGIGTDVNTKDPKYIKSNLLGTASKGR